MTIDKRFNIAAYLGRPFDREKVKVAVSDETKKLEILDWNEPEVQPTQEQLDNLEAEANALESNHQVDVKRQAEYPSIQDLVVALYDTEDKTAIDAKRAEIKLKYPKP